MMRGRWLLVTGHCGIMVFSSLFSSRYLFHRRFDDVVRILVVPGLRHRFHREPLCLGDARALFNGERCVVRLDKKVIHPAEDRLAGLILGGVRVLAEQPYHAPIKPYFLSDLAKRAGFGRFVRFLMALHERPVLEDVMDHRPKYLFALTAIDDSADVVLFLRRGHLAAFRMLLARLAKFPIHRPEDAVHEFSRRFPSETFGKFDGLI